uniref:Uncharacterized protein n=1 Tax=Meloidogyne enterolobii TaxID=390850 RepID=A0A6V7W2E2_MELEN|nr:unnamed protein product [Meloidogyne enterolobii]
MSNVLLLYAILILANMVEYFMNFIVLFTYSDPCECLIPVWLVYLIRMPFIIYVNGSPLFHFAIMIERVLATVYVKIYENQGKIFGIISSIIAWTLVFIHCLYSYITTQMDTDTFGHPMVYLTLTTKYNSQMLIFANFFFLFLVICIAIADYYLIVRNQKIKSNFFKSATNYNLSQSYQSKQNILLMKIIFPLDFFYSFVFALFNLLANVIRYNREQYGQLFYTRTYESLTLVIFIYLNI